MAHVFVAIDIQHRQACSGDMGQGKKYPVRAESRICPVSAVLFALEVEDRDALRNVMIAGEQSKNH